MNTGEQKIASYMEALGSSAPVPAGGSASALLGASGAQLAAMVLSLSLGKKRFAAYEEEIREALLAFSDAGARFLQLSDADEEAFLPLAALYKTKALTEEERRLREEAMETALFNAASVPLQVMELSLDMILRLRRLLTIGTRLAASDVGVAAKALSAALDSAMLNVAVNAQSMKNRAAADRLMEKAAALRKEGGREAEAVFDAVYAMLADCGGNQLSG